MRRALILLIWAVALVNLIIAIKTLGDGELIGFINLIFFVGFAAWAIVGLFPSSGDRDDDEKKKHPHGNVDVLRDDDGERP